ncbi:MAG: hypothetical protein PHT07_02700 [Paludibacter sp.]|nr:hypothetical protein [Paludibacter sp.]
MKKKLEIQLPCFNKGFIVLIILLFITMTGFSQNVSISPAGALPANPAAGLDVNFTTQGLLVPRVALTASTSFLPLAAHVAGMIVYNTVSVADVVPGLYYNNGAKWIPVFPKATTTGDMLYWDGATWKSIPIGQPGQKLQLVAGVPTWVN